MEVNHAIEVMNAIRTSAPQAQPAEEQAAKEAEASKEVEKPRKKQQDIQRVENTANKTIEVRTRHARYRIDRAQGDIVAFIVDENNEVVKQIPPEELRRAAQQVERLQGLFFDQLA